MKGEKQRGTKSKDTEACFSSQAHSLLGALDGSYCGRTSTERTARQAKKHEHTKSRTEIAGIAVCCSYRRRKRERE